MHLFFITFAALFAVAFASPKPTHPGSLLGHRYNHKGAGRTLLNASPLNPAIVKNTKSGEHDLDSSSSGPAGRAARFSFRTGLLKRLVRDEEKNVDLLSNVGPRPLPLLTDSSSMPAADTASSTTTHYDSAQQIPLRPASHLHSHRPTSRQGHV